MNIMKKNVMEEVENPSSREILTKEEKDYLSTIIKPFRDRIIYITKDRLIRDEFIEICLEHYSKKDISTTYTLPYFERDTMYKGMKIGKKYTVDELGI